MRRIVYLVCFIKLILLFSACATSKGAQDGVVIHNIFADMPPGALLYARIDVEPSRKLVDEVLTYYKLNVKTIKTFFDRTNEVVIAVYNGQTKVAEAPERRFLLIGYGNNYPAGLSSFSFFFNPAWRKIKSITGKKYWKSSKNGLSLFMQKNKTHISDTDPFFIEDNVEAPESFTVFSEGSCISAWLTNISPLNKALERIDMPITIPANAVFIAAFQQGENWSLVLRVETPGTAQARGLVSVLSMLRAALAGNYIRDERAAAFARLLLSEPPQIDGAAFVLKSPPLSQTELAGLIASLLIYLK
ncbi:MAG: hypothetical protein LBC27_04630 [Spirochaetaceae bacterium]|jgi:hypothetical protein|nr:hypothetical protein [Spirochaetaceae bacterium]